MESEIDFEKMQGLAPAIAQDAVSGEVLCNLLQPYSQPALDQG